MRRAEPGGRSPGQISEAVGLYLCPTNAPTFCLVTGVTGRTVWQSVSGRASLCLVKVAVTYKPCGQGCHWQQPSLTLRGGLVSPDITNYVAYCLGVKNQKSGSGRPHSPTAHRPVLTSARLAHVSLPRHLLFSRLLGSSTQNTCTLGEDGPLSP